jgi:hypothetical protein
MQEQMEKNNANLYKMMKEEFASQMDKFYGDLAQKNFDISEKYTKEQMELGKPLDSDMTTDEAITKHNELVKNINIE